MGSEMCIRDRLCSSCCTGSKPQQEPTTQQEQGNAPPPQRTSGYRYSIPKSNLPPVREESPPVSTHNPNPTPSQETLEVVEEEPALALSLALPLPLPLPLPLSPLSLSRAPPLAPRGSRPALFPSSPLSCSRSRVVHAVGRARARPLVELKPLELESVRCTVKRCGAQPLLRPEGLCRPRSSRRARGGRARARARSSSSSH